MALWRVLHCRCAYRDFVPEGVREKAAGLAAAYGDRARTVPDLCLAAERKDPELLDWIRRGPVLVLACQYRAVRWLLQWAGLDVAAGELACIDPRQGLDEAAVAERLGRPAEANPAPAPDPGRPEEWVPWFPVLDYDRCKQCRQCLSFCPFGVYELTEEGGVAVRNPRSCKDDCPACARMCPEAAIIFPKFKEAPINGAPVDDAEVARRRAAAVKERLKHADIHQILAQRRRRGAARPDPAAGQAGPAAVEP